MPHPTALYPPSRLCRPRRRPTLIRAWLTPRIAHQVVYEFLLHVKGIIGQRVNKLSDQLALVEADLVTVRSMMPPLIRSARGAVPVCGSKGRAGGACSLCSRRKPHERRGKLRGSGTPL